MSRGYGKVERSILAFFSEWGAVRVNVSTVNRDVSNATNKPLKESETPDKSEAPVAYATSPLSVSGPQVMKTAEKRTERQKDSQSTKEPQMVEARVDLRKGDFRGPPRDSDVEKKSRSEQASFSRALSSLFKAGRLRGSRLPETEWWYYSVNVNDVRNGTRLTLSEPWSGSWDYDASVAKMRDALVAARAPAEAAVNA